jgi:hypothetical protein
MSAAPRDTATFKRAAAQLLELVFREHPEAVQNFFQDTLPNLIRNVERILQKADAAGGGDHYLLRPVVHGCIKYESPERRDDRSLRYRIAQ